MNPLSAMMPAGRGRSGPRPSAYDITVPCEKPPKTVRAGSMPWSASSASTQLVSSSHVGQNVSGSG